MTHDEEENFDRRPGTFLGILSILHVLRIDKRVYTHIKDTCFLGVLNLYQLNMTKGLPRRLW